MQAIEVRQLILTFCIRDWKCERVVMLYGHIRLRFMEKCQHKIAVDQLRINNKFISFHGILW